jgi:hypothetical protein
MRVECRFVDVAGVHENLVVARPQIQLGEEGHTMKLIQELFDNWDREFILDYLAVERM